MVSSYLSPSRHGVFYFRWPLPALEGHPRRTIRLSLRTHCPVRAGDLARHLASDGRLIQENKTLAGLRQDEIREKVQAYFKAQLDQYLDRQRDWARTQRQPQVGNAVGHVHRGAFE